MSKLWIFGDSILKGVTMDASGRYVLCQSRNFDTLVEAGVEVCNRSKMGATVDKGAQIVEKSEGVDGLVLLEYGGNDCDYDWESIAQNPQGEHAPKLSLSSYKEIYRKLIRSLKQAGRQVMLCALPPIDAVKYFAHITKDRAAENILKWLGDVSMLSRWQEIYSAAVRELALEEGCPLVDLRTPFLESHRFEELLSADGIHPTQAGHDLIERTLRAAVC